jgi:hypothetical protein
VQEIELKLTVEEVNLVLEGLGNLPFKQVYGLVTKLQEQAGPQVAAAAGNGADHSDGQEAADEG